MTAGFSPDGKKVVTTSSNATLQIWDANSGKELHRLEWRDKDTGLGASTALFFPNGKHIAAWTHSDSSFVVFWNTESAKVLHNLEEHVGVIYAIALSPNGTTFATGNPQNTLSIWDVDSEKELHALKGHTNSIGSIAFSSDGKKIVTTSYDKTVRLWDTESGTELQQLNIGVSVAVFTPDGKKFVTAGGDGPARIWDAESGKGLQKFNGSINTVRSIIFSPDGKKFVTTDWDHFRGTVPNKRAAQMWDIESGKMLRTFDGYMVTFSPDSKKVAFVGADTNSVIRIWESDTGKEWEVPGHPGFITSVDISPDGKRIVSAGFGGTVRIWDLERTRPLPPIRDF